MMLKPEYGSDEYLAEIAANLLRQIDLVIWHNKEKNWDSLNCHSLRVYEEATEMLSICSDKYHNQEKYD